MKNNNFYSTKDFVATVLRLPIEKKDIKRVLYSWGNTNSSSKEEWGTELQFGALIQTTKGVCYISGWNDYTGWGCQDGVKMYFDSSWFVYFGDNELTSPELIKKECIEKFEDLEESDFKEIEWEKDPVDLNRWLKGEIQVDEAFL